MALNCLPPPKFHTPTFAFAVPSSEYALPSEIYIPSLPLEFYSKVTFSARFPLATQSKISITPTLIPKTSYSPFRFFLTMHHYNTFY